MNTNEEIVGMLKSCPEKTVWINTDGIGLVVAETLENAGITVKRFSRAKAKDPVGCGDKEMPTPGVPEAIFDENGINRGDWLTMWACAYQDALEFSKVRKYIKCLSDCLTDLTR